MKEDDVADADAGTRRYVTLEVADGVAVLTLQRPPMNALSVAVQSEVAGAAREADQRADVAALVDGLATDQGLPEDNAAHRWLDLVRTF